MKIKISTVVDVPEEALLRDSRFESAVQVVFDAITKYLNICHSRDARKWCAKAKVIEGEPNDGIEYEIFQHHDFWADQCDKLKWDYEEVKG